MDCICVSTSALARPLLPTAWLICRSSAILATSRALWPAFTARSRAASASRTSRWRISVTTLELALRPSSSVKPAWIWRGTCGLLRRTSITCMPSPVTCWRNSRSWVSTISSTWSNLVMVASRSVMREHTSARIPTTGSEIRDFSICWCVKFRTNATTLGRWGANTTSTEGNTASTPDMVGHSTLWSRRTLLDFFIGTTCCSGHGVTWTPDCRTSSLSLPA
mmetsp:Transcript_20229/g.77647  ORF Transcript_20229/g.77647 Transcript_20229/m.77647 type:complete len:221 (+) Transcript_20229:517-1179(+)